MQHTGMEGSNPAAGLAEEGASRLGRVSETAQQALDRITRAAQDAAERLGERSEELWALQGRAIESARGYAKQHPLATIGVAIAIGVVISKLLSLRK
jgi:ElaB/YqjD/DUF883 family membrane-anchored ribosome-binding protein